MWYLGRWKHSWPGMACFVTTIDDAHFDLVWLLWFIPWWWTMWFTHIHDLIIIRSCFPPYCSRHLYPSVPVSCTLLVRIQIEHSITQAPRNWQPHTGRSNRYTKISRGKINKIRHINHQYSSSQHRYMYIHNTGRYHQTALQIELGTRVPIGANRQTLTRRSRRRRTTCALECDRLACAENYHPKFSLSMKAIFPISPRRCRNRGIGIPAQQAVVRW